MTFNIRDAQTLTYLAVRLRQETYGCGKWDHAGTYSVIRELIGQGFAENLHRVIGHAMDPEARTPGAMRRPFVPKRQDEPGRRQPAKAGEDCKAHPGEYVGSCRQCAVQHIEVPTDPVLADDDRSAGRALLAEIRARRQGVQLVPLRPDEVPPLIAQLVERPETACAADGCYRPTTDGICDRCREKAIAVDVQAANTELVERLRANELERARTRPEPDPSAPAQRYFTSADYDPEKVHAAQARAAAERSNR